MGEIGEVVEILEDKVRIKLQRTEACAKCKACSVGLTGKEMLIIADNICKARIGDKVEIALEEVRFIQAVLIMYGIPFVMLLIGVLVGYFGAVHYNIGYPELIGLGLGFVLVIISYLWIKSMERHWKKAKFTPVAKKIVE